MASSSTAAAKAVKPAKAGKPPKGVWIPSVVRDADLEALEADGLLPVKNICTWHAVTDKPRPNPQGKERVMLTSHIFHGLMLPPSDLFLDVLKHYGVQPHHLPPNIILHLAGFVAFCEGYLGIRPRLDLFRFCFQVKRQAVTQGSVLASCGSISLMLRKHREYPEIPYIESVKGWTCTFFYCKDVPAEGRAVGL